MAFQSDAKVIYIRKTIIPGYININNSWKLIADIYINIGDVWRTVTEIDANIENYWKRAVFKGL